MRLKVDCVSIWWAMGNSFGCDVVRLAFELQGKEVVSEETLTA